MAFRQLFPEVVRSPGSSSSFLVPRPHSGFAWGLRFREGCRRGGLVFYHPPEGLAHVLACVEQADLSA